MFFCFFCFQNFRVHQVCLVIQVLRVPLVPLAPLDGVQWVIKDQQDPLAPPVPLGTVLLVSLAARACLESQVKVECQANEGILDLQDPKEQEEPRAHLAALDQLDILLPESLDLTVCQEQWDPGESLVQRDSQVYTVFLVQKVKQVTVCPEVPVPLVPWARLVLLVSLVNLDLASLVQLVTLENLENQVCRVGMGLQDP